MKIDRNKLNILLRSGLNPEIKTRKHLAAHLSLDPTSLTRWFASRDRLGNPRYPVVPDRHVTKILQLFDLDPQSLNLNDDEFRDYCFENALSKTNHQDDLEQKNKIRLANAQQRKLNISDYSTASNKWPVSLIVSLITLPIIAWYILTSFYSKDLPSLMTDSAENEINETINKADDHKVKCWTGYSASLGVFEEEDKADPCHYGKLFHLALMQLKAENNSLNSSTTLTKSYGHQSYIRFLFEQLENRRVRDNITLHIELGKSELHRLNHQAAKAHFDKAYELLTLLPNPPATILAEISLYAKKMAKDLP